MSEGSEYGADTDQAVQTRVYQVTGPPGTGKTTTLARYCEDAVERHGSDRVVVASLTRAAAAEIAGRGIHVDHEHVGTLHALCYRALGHPEIAESHIGEWNEQAVEFRLTVDPGSAGLEVPSEPAGMETIGDRIRDRVEMLRHRLVPETEWGPTELRFFALWSKWLADSGLIDFTGLLEQAIHELDAAPGSPAVLIGDEVQDWSRLEARLFRDVWGAEAGTVVLAADPDQAIYEWRGADPRIFLDAPVPPEQERLLGQSYRVPREVHALAQRVIRRIPSRRDVEYRPREEDGDVSRSHATWRSPELLLPLIERALSDGESVMILASCGYLLAPTLAVLRRNGIPFSNRYRAAEGRWNPLARGTAKRTMPVDRVLAFLRPSGDVWGSQAAEWESHDVDRWIDPLVSDGVLARGAKTLAKSDGFEIARDFERLFVGGLESSDARAALALDLAWYRSSLLPSRLAPLDFPLRVAERRGGAALLAAPMVTIGTIHSVKGGQSDTVILFPDLSMQAYREATTPVGRDAIHRLYYVAITRARQRVILCQPSTPSSVRLA